VTSKITTRFLSLKDYEKWLNDNYAGWGTELEADGCCSASEAVYDIAKSFFDFPDDEARAAIGYLRYSGVTDVLGRLADDLWEVAYKQ